ncbi:DNA cytosine methyltransferase [Calothrix sp. PCC 6303]|uniref:DNA cytosine methyltransferase n=1 Tax=Calothrix sp. PCC 6303 TaxID=1170562 RepID=UPI0002A003A2|nr:DNA cytosine methyltransferase [Calothrix sp. PCC 6303]AFZ01340.1 DNA-cytosine methyltransferase [Calothrix sp. PCC 6303]
MLSKNKKLVVSLFCGIGGLDLGFQSAGFEVAIAIDNNPKVLELYQNNFPDTTVLCKDIGEITATEIRDIIQHKYQDWDGEIAAVIGGPPCQGFSVAGKQKLDDDRNQLVLKFINLVIELNPSMFVMENVPAIEWKKFAGITGNAIALIEEQYILSKWLLTASDYGVPQKRQRAIWIGSKFGEVIPPLESDKKVTVGDAISDLSYIPINSQTDTWELGEKGEYAEYLDKIFTSTLRRRLRAGRLSDHPCVSKSLDISGFQATVHTAATQQKYTDTKPGEKESTTWAYRLVSDGFSPTLRAGSGNRTAARPIHYEHARVITVREAARLHSFPDWFDFGTSKLAAHKAIGNSVPPLLAYAIASEVWTHLEEQQQSSTGTNCFVFKHLLDLQTLEASLSLPIFHSMGQQSGKLNCLAFGLVDAENAEVGNERSPPVKNIFIS